MQCRYRWDRKTYNVAAGCEGSDSDLTGALEANSSSSSSSSKRSSKFTFDLSSACAGLGASSIATSSVVCSGLMVASVMAAEDSPACVDSGVTECGIAVLLLAIDEALKRNGGSKSRGRRANNAKRVN